MKNLNVSCIKSARFNLEVLNYCFDSDNEITYILNNLYEIYTISRTEPDPVLYQSLRVQGKVLSFEYLVEARGILVVLEDGSIILIRRGFTKQLYQHEYCICSVALSPCQEWLALADEKYNLQLMLPSEVNFKMIEKVNLLKTNDSINKPVGTGWGSKETQFFGLDGRQTRKSDEPEKVIKVGELEEFQKIESSDQFSNFKQSQEKNVSIDWRGDSQMFATLSYLQKHRLKVWNKRLELLYMSEKLIEIERGILSYVPDGRFICCAQRRQSKISEITFFEKNGLVRHGFQLPSLLDDSFIQTIAWSPNSEILAVIVKRFVCNFGEISVRNILLLYTMQNWHYYLKLSCYLSDACDCLVRWNSNVTNRLHILTTNGQYSEYDICSRVDYSRFESTVFVVDANRILITQLAKVVIPPPMFEFKLELDDLIYKIGIDCDTFTRLCILTMSGRIIWCSYSLAHYMNGPDVLANLYSLTSFGFIKGHNLIQHIVPYECDDEEINTPIILGSRICESGTELISMQLCSSQEGQIVDVEKKYDNQYVMGMGGITHNKICYLILRDGSSILWNWKERKYERKNYLSVSEDNSSSSTVLDLDCINHSKISGRTDDYSCISLCKNMCLSFDDYLICANSCTSFRTTKNFIVYTTTDNLLQFLHISELESRTDAYDLKLYSQPIENSGLLISADEYTSKVVLQMPRGNVETIYPRLFILSNIIEDIQASSYTKACQLAKRHRVNMNFLVDLIMRKWENRLSDFICIVAKDDPSLLSIVLTELDDGDTIAGRYGSIVCHLPAFRQMTEDADQQILEDKVNKFCKLVSELEESKYLEPDFPEQERKQRLELKKTQYLHLKLQSLVKMQPRQIEEALRIIFDLQNESLKQEAIKYMLYFTDIEELFKSSLCTYNTDITLMVAASSNKDPKQFLDFINDLKTSDEVIELKHYKINLYVKRYDKAFENLLKHRVNIEQENSTTSQLTRIDQELTELVTSKKLYRITIRMLDREKGLEDLKASIWAYYADYLLQKRHYEESGWAYSKAYTYSFSKKNYDLALVSYAFVNNWEKSVAFIARSFVEDSVKIGSLEKISRTLFETGQYETGCFVLTGMSNENLDIVLQTLLDGSNWYLIEFVAKRNQMDILKEQIRSAVMERLVTFIDETKKEVLEAKQRLSRLHSIQRRRQLEEPKEKIQFVSDTLSTVDGSDASSLSQSSQSATQPKSGATSIKTRCSSKSVSINKKRINLKEGSRYEDLAIVVELRLFLSNQMTTQVEATKIISSVFEYCSLDYATLESAKLHKLLRDRLDQANLIVEKLWPPVDSDDSLSVIKRMERHFVATGMSTNLGILENVDFQVCIKPDLPKQVICFDL